MKRSKSILPFIIIFALIAGSIETDVSVPGFPAMASEFNVSESTIQETLSINFLGLFIGTLFFGPLSDFLGRRKTMIIGLFFFALFSLICSFTTSLVQLLIARFFQGLGAGAAPVVAYSIIGDVYKGSQATKFIGLMNAVVTGVMAAAPAIGAFICKIYNWHFTYGFIAILSCISCILAVGFLSETSKESKNFNVANILYDYMTLLKDPTFLLYCLASNMLVAAYVGYVASASFLYIDRLSISLNEYAIHQSLVVGMFSLVSFKSGWLQTKIGEARIMWYSVILTTISTIMIVLLSKVLPNSAAVFTFNMMLFSTGAAIIMSIVVAKSLSVFPNKKGISSSLVVGIRTLCCSLGAWTAGLFYTGELFDTALLIFILSSIATIGNVIILLKGFESEEQQKNEILTSKP